MKHKPSYKIALSGLAMATIALPVAFLLTSRYSANRTSTRETTATVIHEIAAPSSFSGENGFMRIFGSDELVVAVAGETGQNRIAISFTEWNPNANKYESEAFTFVTSYDIIRWDARPGGELFLLGLDQNQTPIIERIRINRPTGAWAASLPTYSAQLGTPVPISGPPTASVIGGTFVAPAARQPTTFSRLTIYNQSQFSDPISLSADPEGRFVFVIDGATGVWQIPAAFNATASHIASPSTTTACSHLTTGIEPWAASGTGGEERVWIAQTNMVGSGNAVTFYDVDNDGVIETIIDQDYNYYPNAPSTLQQSLIRKDR